MPPSDTAIAGSHGNAQEQTLREELLMFVGDRCCLGTQPARTWQFDSVTSSVSYAATMESFVQIRRPVRSSEPFFGGSVDGYPPSQSGGRRGIGMWDVSVHGHEPDNFKNREVTLGIPHSDSVEVCDECQGQGGTSCHVCEGGARLENCRTCRGTGRNEEDEICESCIGTGCSPCGSCSSLGLIQCNGCSGTGSLLIKQYVVISWITVTSQVIVHEDKSCHVPDNNVLQGQGSLMLKEEGSNLSVLTLDDEKVRNVSREVLQQRNRNMPPGSKIICERLTVLQIPVTKSVLTDHDKMFEFYVVGLKRSMYLDGYPSKCLKIFPFSCFPCGGSCT